MTVFRASALIEDQLRELGWNVIFTNTGSNSGLFNITAMRDNVCIPIYIRHLDVIDHNDSSISKKMAVIMSDFVENLNCILVFLLTKRGVALYNINTKSDIENMLRQTKSMVEDDLSRYFPLEMLVSKAIDNLAVKTNRAIKGE